MRFPLIPVLVLLLVNCGIDLYIYRALLKRTANRLWSRIQLWCAALFFIAMIVIICLPKRQGDDGAFLALMWCLYAYLSIYLSKYLFVVFDLIAKLPQLWHRRRSKTVTAAGIVMAVACFLLLWWGALINRYNIDIKKVEFASAEVPVGFDGFRIVQISDLHTGSYGSDDSFLTKLVELVNGLNPDMIVFTGDIVNRHSSELEPFVDVLGALKAPYGIWSILGNHDYGDYYDWTSDDAKAENMRQLYDMQHAMNWNLLLNQHAPVVCGTDTLMLIGVENLGDPPFKNYGDLKAAYPTLGDGHFKLLLSHNPAHWTNDISGHPEVNIPLTLSGHTHAMQISAGRVSPAVFRYKTWGGMYSDDAGHNLYVNIGTGTVGMPARIGATPEITVITLRHSSK